MEETIYLTGEEITVINEYKELGTISIVVSYKTSDGITISKDDYQISGEDYDLLMSQSPDFAPGKPENEYREVDLWFIIDLIREQKDIESN